MDNTSSRLVNAFVKFLVSEVAAMRPSADLTESLEVAIQLLESAYGVSHLDHSDDPPLDAIFMSAVQPDRNPFANQPDAAVDNKTEAEKCKNEGNNLVKENKLSEALSQYTMAINYDNKNAVYYCNRAAAYNKLKNHYAAVMDCKTALKIDPKYSKAYGRLGVAYANMKMHAEAMESYKKALELEPDNETYTNNHRISMEMLNTDPSQAAPNLQDTLSAGNAQMGNLLGNPALTNMANEMMSNPIMQNLMSNLMSGSGMDAFVQASQVFAQQMQAVNPELIENLRRSLSGDAPPQNPPDMDDSAQ